MSKKQIDYDALAESARHRGLIRTLRLLGAKIQEIRYEESWLSPMYDVQMPSGLQARLVDHHFLAHWKVYIDGRVYLPNSVSVAMRLLLGQKLRLEHLPENLQIALRRVQSRAPKPVSAKQIKITEWRLRELSTLGFIKPAGRGLYAAV